MQIAKRAPAASHNENVLALLRQSEKPLTAYEIMARLHLKAPPTVYRALAALVRKGAAHRIESLNAFVACCGHHDGLNVSFAVCRSCGSAEEIHDQKLGALVRALGRKLAFRIEREVLELSGLCKTCAGKEKA